MGFKTTRVDANLWIKPIKDSSSYDHIATHVDDIMHVVHITTERKVSNEEYIYKSGILFGKWFKYSERR